MSRKWASCTKEKNILDQFRLQFNFTAISAAVSEIFITSRNCCGRTILLNINFSFSLVLTKYPSLNFRKIEFGKKSSLDTVQFCR